MVADYRDAMPDSDEPANPWGDLFRALSAVAPTDLASQATRTFETLLRAADTAIDTLAAVNQAARRLNSLLDDLEEPLRSMVPEVAAGLATLGRLNDAASALSDLAQRFAPMANFFPTTKANPDA